MCVQRCSHNTRAIQATQQQQQRHIAMMHSCWSGPRCPAPAPPAGPSGDIKHHRNALLLPCRPWPGSASREVVVQQQDVGGVLGDGGARGHGKAHVSRVERGRVVGAVTRHGHRLCQLPARTQRLERLQPGRSSSMSWQVCITQQQGCCAVCAGQQQPQVL